MLPQLAVGGETPTPRNEIADSAMMNPPTLREADTMIGASELGIRWTSMMRRPSAPNARAAIISVMLGGPQCFNELLAAVPDLSDRLLTERLRELESEGLVRRTVIPGPPVRVSYELTEAGESLKPVIESLGRWAERWVKA